MGEIAAWQPAVGWTCSVVAPALLGAASLKHWCAAGRASLTRWPSASPCRCAHAQVDVLVEMKDATTVIPRNSLIEANQSGLIAEPLIDITPQPPVPDYKGGLVGCLCAHQAAGRRPTPQPPVPGSKGGLLVRSKPIEGRVRLCLPPPASNRGGACSCQPRVVPPAVPPAVLPAANPLDEGCDPCLPPWPPHAPASATLTLSVLPAAACAD